MDSLLHSVELKNGLGDCIVAAASIQEYARKNKIKIDFHTNEKLNFLFDGHPNINIKNENSNFKLKWVSQLQHNLYSLHTMQRFSYQMGFFIDPVEVLDIYVKGQLQKAKKNKKFICVNQFSAEKNRRYIPDETIEIIEKEIKKNGYECVYIGDCNKQSIKNIEECVKLLLECKFFIGPVSFLYHLASSLRVDCLLLTNYMPEYKFSHFFNTISVNPERKCYFRCEELESRIRKENECWDRCKAADYNEEELIKKINYYI